jgi:hypothetical protein
MKIHLLLAPLILLSSEAAFAQTVPEQVQAAYNAHRTFKDKNIDAAHKDAAARSLLAQLQSPEPSIVRAAARALSVATLDWVPGIQLTEEILGAVVPRLKSERTPDLGTRADLVQLAGRISVRLVPESDPVTPLVEWLQAALWNLVKTDSDAPVVIGAAVALYNLPMPDAERGSLISQLQVHSRPSVRALLPGSVPVSSPYEPVAAGKSLEELYAHADALMFESKATGKNLAANVLRDPTGPRVLASEHGWGQGPDPMDLLAGDLVCTNDFGYRCGLALPGNGYGGVSGGWHHVTLILPKAAAVDHFALHVYDYLKAPVKYRLLACAEAECADSDWAVVAEEEKSDVCTKVTDPEGCRVDIRFKALAARQLRLEVDDSAFSGPDRHLWITGIEAFEAGVPPNEG